MLYEVITLLADELELTQQVGDRQRLLEAVRGTVYDDVDHDANDNAARKSPT